MAWETLHGVGSGRGRAKPNKDKVKARTYLASTTQDRQNSIESSKLCKVCNGQHGVWRCNAFKSLKVWQRWNMAKQCKLCYKCLESGHLAQSCTKGRECGLNGCKLTHHRLLHKNVPLKPTGPMENQPDEMPSSSSVKPAVV